MKKYPKLVQCDKRGQIVIPKDIRSQLNLDEGSGFWVYSIGDEGILLKKVNVQALDENDDAVQKIMKKSSKLGLDKKKVKKSVKQYKKTKQGNLEII